MPHGVGIVDFIRFDRRMPSAPVGKEDVARTLTSSAFRDAYLKTYRPSLEPRTVEGIELHYKHLLRILGDGFPIRGDRQ